VVQITGTHCSVCSQLHSVVKLRKGIVQNNGDQSVTRAALVSMLASGTQDRGFKPGRSRRIFLGVKILSMPSFGREVKRFVPCRRFAARKRTLLDYAEVEILRPNYSDVSRSKFPPSLTEGLQRSSMCAGAPRSAPTLEWHGRPLEMKGGNKSNVVHKGPV
jgi:hypothetical protein